MGGGEVKTRRFRIGRGLAVAVVSAALGLSGVVAANATVVGWGGRDVTFTPPTLNGPVNTMIQLKIGANAGKYLIGGSFTDAGGNTAIDYVARLNADGTIDTGFTPPVLSAGTGTCNNGGGTGPTLDVRTLLETQVSSTSVSANTAGKIYIGGNFTDAGGNAKMDYLIRVNANGGAPNTGFFPTDTGATGGNVSYSNCVQTIFTADGTAGTTSLALVVGTQVNGVSKKVFDTGADYAGFTSPTINPSSGAITSGFYCTSGCGGNRYVLGGGFINGINGNAKRAGLVRLNTNGTVDTTAYPTTDGTNAGTALFNDKVNSIALDSSDNSILVGGQFTNVGGDTATDYIAKVALSNFAPADGYTAPTVNGNVWSVAVDPKDPEDPTAGTPSYVFAGGFTDAGDVPQCDYICNSDQSGSVGWYFQPPPPTDVVRVVKVNDYADANVGKYMIGGAFTDLGGNTATDYVARLNQATPASITINSTGGNNAGGTDGIRTFYSNGQWQVLREGAGQLYSPGPGDVPATGDGLPPDRYQFNQIALALTDGGGGGYIIGPSTLNMNNQYWNTSDRLFRPWDSVTATGGSPGTGTGSSDLSVQVDGRTYVVHLALDYTYPNNYITQTFSVTVPAGNTYNVKLYNLYDSYLGGSDNGAGFYNSSAKIVGVSGQTVYEGLRYVSGQAWAGYMSAHYEDVVFGLNSNIGPGTGTNLDNSIITDPTNDNGFGVNWDFGTAAGTTTVATDLIFGSLTAPTAAPTSAAGAVKVDWTDPVGITPAPDSYVVTAYDGATATAFTCTASAPTHTCTVTGLDPAIEYTFLVDFRSSGSTVFTSASNAVHPKREVTVKIWGDPTSVGSAVTFSHTLGSNPDSYMAAYTGLTAANQAVPSVTPTCSGSPIAAVEATPSGPDGEYKATVGCQDGISDIDDYSVKITVGAGSCLIASGLSTGTGTYNVGTTQQTIPTYGTNLPDGANTPAYQAIKDATPSKAFAPADVAGVYLKATRACTPSSAPSTSSTATVAGSIPMTVTAPISNGGSALFAVADLGAVNGFNRVLAEPTNTTGTGGGYRTTYYRCGVTNASGTNLNCLLSSVAVTTGGTAGRWNPAACTNQTINFRSRYMTQMGYGLWSNSGSKLLTGGCS